jgi:flagellar motor protein MotB
VPSKPFPPGPAPAPPPRPAAPAGPAATALLAPDAPPGPEPPAASDPATEEPPPRPSEQAVEPGGWAARGRLVGVIQFLDGSISVDARDRSILRDIALLQQQRGGRIRVVGHASGRAKSLDPAAHRLANFELSLGRARNVALAMTEFGVDPEILQVVAASASEPAYEESQPTGEAGNRRVEIFLEY